MSEENEEVELDGEELKEIVYQKLAEETPINELRNNKKREPMAENTENDYCEWIKAPNGIYVPTSKITIVNKIDPGLYDIDYDHNRECYIFRKKKLNLDEILKLPNPVFEQILDDMTFFWDNFDRFIKYKFAVKRGILLYGDAGCGKTSLTDLLSQIVIDKKGGLIFQIQNYCDLEYYSHAIPKYLRKIEPETPILNIFEDLDGLVRSSESETLLLNILDGFNQSHNVVNIGCTNYPENLKARILNRPSRFDKRYYIGLPDANVRKYYFENKIIKEDIDKYDINDLVVKTEGLTISHLGELIKSVYIFQKDLDKSIEELKDMKNFISSSKFDSEKKSTGFLSTKK